MTKHTETSGATEYLIRTARSANLTDAGPDVVTRLRCYVLDWLGVTLLGARTESSRIAHSVVPTDGHGECAIVGAKGLRASPHDAAMLNGIASHALDYDDGSGTGGLPHSSVTILPTILALGENRDLTGHDLLTAILAGQELGVRVTEMVEPEHYAHGFHSLSTTGVLAAVAAGARMIGLSEDQWDYALGIGASSASGLRANFGTMTKPFHAGRAAGGAVLACLLAESGYTAAPGILERRNGYTAVLAPEPRIGAGLRPLAHPFVIEGTRFKYHASCTGTQSTIDALSALRHSGELDAAQVEAIRIAVHPTMLDVCDIVNPTTALEAKFSIRYAAALAVNGDDTSEAGFTDQRVNDPMLRSMMRKVEVEVLDDPRTNDDTVVMVRLADGRTLTTRHNFAGHRLPLDREVEAVTAKFRRVTANILSPARADSVIESVKGLDERTTVRQLLALACD